MHETNPIARATGTVRIGDLDIYKDAKPVQIRRRVGMVFQRPNPFPTMSIYDNVAAGLKLNGYSQPPRPRRNRRTLTEEFCPLGRGQRRPEKEIRRQPLRRPAAAPLHRPRSRRRP
jgi:ABC-type sugar transport system ATPase subunit